jgi:sugar phosphate isomerase/epimerase
MYKTLSADALGLSGRPSELIELALSHGYKGIDLDLVDFAHQVERNGAAHALRLLASAKLKLGAFRLPIAWDGDDAQFRPELAKLVRLAETAAAAGCQRAITTIAPANDQRPFHENFEFHRRRLGELGKALEPHGVWLGIDFVAPAPARLNHAFEFLHTFDAVLMLLDLVPSSNVGMVVNSWQIHASGGDPAKLRKLGSDRIVDVLLADAPADVTPSELTDEARLLPGETGTPDSAALLTLLAEIGYDGPVAACPHRAALAGKSRDACVKVAAAALDRVWKAAGLSPAGKLAAGARG